MMQLYHPTEVQDLNVTSLLKDPRPSAWAGLERILKSIVMQYGAPNLDALEFGVEYGFSTAAITQFFPKVIGVDTFIGDIHSGVRTDFLEDTKHILSGIPNIELVQATYQDFTADPHNDRMYGLIHIDIVHTFEDTFACGEWAIKHAPVVIFHDTESFQGVRIAIERLAEQYGLQCYNYPFCNGLGILVTGIE